MLLYYILNIKSCLFLRFCLAWLEKLESYQWNGCIVFHVLKIKGVDVALLSHFEKNNKPYCISIISHLELDLNCHRMAFHASLAASCERASDGGCPTQRVAALESRDRSGHAGGHRAAAREEQLG